MDNPTPRPAGAAPPCLRVLVTGGASGLGAAFAQAYADQRPCVLTGDIQSGDLHPTYAAMMTGPRLCFTLNIGGTRSTC